MHRETAEGGPLSIGANGEQRLGGPPKWQEVHRYTTGANGERGARGDRPRYITVANGGVTQCGGKFLTCQSCQLDWQVTNLPPQLAAAAPIHHGCKRCCSDADSRHLQRLAEVRSLAHRLEEVGPIGVGAEGCRRQSRGETGCLAGADALAVA